MGRSIVDGAVVIYNLDCPPTWLQAVRDGRDAESDLAWAGGVLEAKGYANHRPGHFLLRLTDTRPELLERFAEVVGVGKVTPSGNSGTRAQLQQWRWEAWTQRDIEGVLAELGPYLFDETKARLTP